MDNEIDQFNMKHVLQFSSAEDIAELYVRERGEVQILKLEGEHNFAFSDQKYCIGFRTDEKRCSCKRGAVNVRQCPTCSYRDVARCYTVGDFTLYPHLYDQLSDEKYVIYLAQFGSDITKVGLTRRSRFMQRWKEQGADLAIALLEFDGPDDAYKAEQLLHSLFDFTGAVRATQKIKRLNFDKEKALERIESAVNIAKTKDSFSDYLTDDKIVDMSKFYPKVANPEIVEYVDGKVLGAKGWWLFFEGASGTHFATNLNSQVGRFIVKKETNGQSLLF